MNLPAAAAAKGAARTENELRQSHQKIQHPVGEMGGNPQSLSDTQPNKYLNPVEEISVSAEARQESTATSPDLQSASGHASISALLGNFGLCGNLPTRVDPVSKSQEAKSSEESVKAFDGKSLAVGSSKSEYVNKLVEVGGDSGSEKIDKNPSPIVASAATKDSGPLEDTGAVADSSSGQNLRSTLQPSQELLEAPGSAQATDVGAPGQLIQARFS